jgi:hypothetical protein
VVTSTALAVPAASRSADALAGASRVVVAASAAETADARRLASPALAELPFRIVKEHRPFIRKTVHFCPGDRVFRKTRASILEKSQLPARVGAAEECVVALWDEVYCFLPANSVQSDTVHTLSEPQGAIPATLLRIGVQTTVFLWGIGSRFVQ